jgi:hypothetical protein
MNKIYNTITSGKVVDWKYSYLNPLKEMLTRENLLQEKLNNDQMNRLRNIMGYYVNHGWLALFRIK